MIVSEVTLCLVIHVHTLFFVSVMTAILLLHQKLPRLARINYLKVFWFSVLRGQQITIKFSKNLPDNSGIEYWLLLFFSSYFQIFDGYLVQSVIDCQHKLSFPALSGVST